MSLSVVAEVPRREKFQIMKAILTDSNEQVERIEIPPEHPELLNARRARVAAGESTLHDWNEVRHTT
jgi:phosphoribosylanthranilate isomerase